MPSLAMHNPCILHSLHEQLGKSNTAMLDLQVFESRCKLSLRKGQLGIVKHAVTCSVLTQSNLNLAVSVKMTNPYMSKSNCSRINCLCAADIWSVAASNRLYICYSSFSVRRQIPSVRDLLQRSSAVVGMKQWGSGWSKLRDYEAFEKLLKTSLFFVVSGSIPFHL